ncbi:hypothetical protein PR202_ga23879 [Eleusine coracana subsp. coracana]|uniref:Rx N-terminal domain-containing protein n=1 Tax=Eleusine coracana subsp. coracana TaxID=191504 RepID=A0AAV5D7R4_ELECO|nr:hypothetical protein PR202_ga23879 [Eleusine coracana subsp. coracana]
MDALLSAVAGDLIGRLISFLIGKYQEHGVTDAAVRLQRALVRASVIVEEAEGRQIANRAMVQQLNQLRRDLCRAVYALDTFRGRAVKLDRRSHAKVSRSATHSRPPPRRYCAVALSIMVENMEATLRNMTEFVVLLGGCPRVTRQPYSTYLLMESCMFGRQMEKAEIIGFLLRPSQGLDVLPVVGPLGVGKRTLVEHVCLDERVRERFTKIHRLSSNDLDVHVHEHDWNLFDFTARSLLVIDIDDRDTDHGDESWRMFHSAVVRHGAHAETKIVFITRTEEHLSLGTVRPIRLHAPSREELWYFFRTLSFGAADPNEHPDLARIAMALCEGTSGFIVLFAAANIIAAALRADLSARSWRRMLKVVSEAILLDEDKAGHCNLFRPVKDAPGVPCLFYNTRKVTSVARSDLPKVTMLGLLTGGSLLPTGETRFDVLVWQSRIPLYASYIATCDTDETHPKTIALKKRLLNKRRRDHQEDGNSN